MARLALRLEFVDSVQCDHAQHLDAARTLPKSRLRDITVLAPIGLERAGCVRDP